MSDAFGVSEKVKNAMERCDYRKAERTVPEQRQDGVLDAMAWIVLVVSGVFEAVWATAMGKYEGFTRLGPTALFGVTVLISVGGLAYSMRTLPVGTSHNVWVGMGAVLPVGYAMIIGDETVSWAKIVLLAMIVGGVVGLKLLH